MKFDNVCLTCAFWILCLVCDTFAYRCEPLSYRIGVRIRCEHPSTGESINCRGEKVPPGAVARYKCDDFFVTLDGDDIGGNMTCNDKGKWTPEHPFRAFTCNMECGRQLGDSQWPWHAVIFKRDSEEAPFKYVCGGTLLNPFNKGLLIVTAAKCINQHLVAGQDVDVRNLKIALGLVTADFSNNQASPEVDFYPVRKIVTNMGAELALIKLGRDVALKENVLPICFNGNSDLTREQVKGGAVGRIVGFEASKKSAGSPDHDLRSIPLQVFPPSHCPKFSSRGQSTICAGQMEGAGVICTGDNGGSISFPSSSGPSRRQFIQGVHTSLISENRRDGCENYGQFSRLVDFGAWIRESAVGFYTDEVLPSNSISSIAANSDRDIAFQRETPAPISPTAPSSPSLLKPKFPLSPIFGHLLPQRRTTTRTTEIHFPGNSEIPNSPDRVPNPYPQAQYPISPGSSSHLGPILRNPTDFELAGLEWHNRYRRRHGVPPLVISHELNVEAQHDADESLRKKQFYSTSGFANWFDLNGAELSRVDAVKEAVKDWYKSSAMYDPNSPESSPFTTMIWKSATELGVGFAQSGQDQVVVVKYKLSNVVGINSKKAFEENVLPAA